MKRFPISLSIPAIILISVVVFLIGCSKTEDAVPMFEAQISPETLEKIARLGFNNEEVIKVKEGYLVERDILLTEENLNSIPAGRRVPNAEQYHTFNLVTAPRTITVRVTEGFDSKIYDATDMAIARYNAENLSLKFQLTSKRNADIVVSPSTSGGFLAYAGFPTKRGDPYGYVRLNTFYMNNNANLNTLASVIAHEIGHCIGFRHTDWFDRSYSCNSGGNEGEGSIGAEHIPGTPTGPDPGSWMLSCIPFSAGADRPFTAADKVALDYLY